jgi:acyl carrier protein
MSVSEVIGTAAVSLLIKATFEQVAREQSKELPPLVNEMVVLESGLDSLCLAIIVSRLADEFGADPFSADESFEFPVTLGDFIELYANASK